MPDRNNTIWSDELDILISLLEKDPDARVSIRIQKVETTDKAQCSMNAQLEQPDKTEWAAETALPPRLPNCTVEKKPTTKEKTIKTHLAFEINAQSRPDSRRLAHWNLRKYPHT